MTHRGERWVRDDSRDTLLLCELRTTMSSPIGLCRRKDVHPRGWRGGWSLESIIPYCGPDLQGHGILYREEGRGYRVPTIPSP